MHKCVWFSSSNESVNSFQESRSTEFDSQFSTFNINLYCLTLRDKEDVQL